MSVLYVVLPLDEDVVTWLESEEIPFPADYSSTQTITPSLVFQVLNELSGVEVGPIQRLNGSIRVDVYRFQRAEWTELGLSEVKSDVGPCGIGFRNGHEPLIEAIVEALARLCGPLILYPGSGENIRVFPGP